MRIFISGASGFLGSSLARACVLRGDEVHGSARDPRRLAGLAGVEAHALALGGDFDAAVLDGCDVLVHCAHDLARGAGARNVEGTRRLAEAARSRGVGLQVFVGSYSAHPGARGEYATAKWEIERFFLGSGLTVLKPGLVIGDGGLFARIRALIARLHIAPLVDAGRGEVPVIGLRDLVSATLGVIGARAPGRWRLYLEERVALRDLVSAVIDATGTRALRVPVPHGLAEAGVRALEALGLDPPVGIDSLRAFRANQAVVEESDLEALVPRPLSLHEMVREAVAGGGARA